MNLKYLGNLNVEARHEPSGKIIRTAAPVDNQGDGSSFSPTDLLSTSLAACILTIMGIKSKDRLIDLEGSTVKLRKHMGVEPRRISQLELEFHLPKGLAEDEQSFLKETARTCPVCESISSSIELDYQFIFDVGDLTTKTQVTS